MTTPPDTALAPVAVSTGDFDTTVLQSKVPVLVDFWAGWCAPCRALAAVLESLAVEQGGRALITKVDIDENVALTERFGISSIPTLVFFRDGKEVDRVTGAATQADLSARLDALA